MLRTGHLFAGLGGGLLADLILGHEPVFAVEIEPGKCDILRGMRAAKWFPGLTVYQGHIEERAILGGASTVAGFDPSDWKGRVDCVHAGFPCQDLSLAGKGAGIHGKRSGLYREAIRVIEAIRPAWVFLENVPAIVSRGRHVVIADLVALGYSWRDGILSAADVGAPHLRKRWWCVATNTNVNERATGNEVEGRRIEQGHSVTAHGCGYVADAVRPGLEIGAPGVQPGPRPCAMPSGSGWWDAEPAVGRVADGVPDRFNRLHGLGNAQVPLCAAAAWCLLGGP